jgi:hypothetical protein
MLTAGPMMFVCRILSRCSSVRLAVIAAPMSGRYSIGKGSRGSDPRLLGLTMVGWLTRPHIGGRPRASRIVRALGLDQPSNYNVLSRDGRQIKPACTHAPAGCLSSVLRDGARNAYRSPPTAVSPCRPGCLDRSAKRATAIRAMMDTVLHILSKDPGEQPVKKTKRS